MCEHKWEPVPFANQFYVCTKCVIIGSKNEKGKIEMERCQGPDCIAPAKYITNDGVPLCNRCREQYFLDIGALSNDS